MVPIWVITPIPPHRIGWDVCISHHISEERPSTTRLKNIVDSASFCLHELSNFRLIDSYEITVEVPEVNWQN